MYRERERALCVVLFYLSDMPFLPSEESGVFGSKLADELICILTLQYSSSLLVKPFIFSWCDHDKSFAAEYLQESPRLCPKRQIQSQICGFRIVVPVAMDSHCHLGNKGNSSSLTLEDFMAAPQLDPRGNGHLVRLNNSTMPCYYNVDLSTRIQVFKMGCPV